jgi:phosphopantetheinyl transferase
MKWSLIEPSVGDMVRVKLGNIYHYGIFVSEDEVIQFGLAPSLRPTVKNTDIEVLSSDIDTFLAGGFLEVAEFERAEKKKNRAPKAVVAYARERIGQKGYDILYNNCEHFAYDCVTGKKYCSQTDDVRAFFKSLPVVDVYFAQIPEEIEIKPILPEEREKEIEMVSNARVKKEKYCVWKLLEYALERSFGYKIKNLDFEHTASGKWKCNRCEFSLSHCDGAVAVAISRAPVGVDIEVQRALSGEKFAERILNEVETDAYNALNESERQTYLIEAWVKKESLFKKQGGDIFSPSKIVTDTRGVRNGRVEIAGREYFYSVATDTPEKLRLYENIDLLKL